MAKFFKRMEEAVKTGNVDQLNRLLDNKDHNFYSQALSQAARTGQLECVKFLVEKCSNNDIYHLGLISAIRHNQSECINYLLSLFTQPFDCSSALCAATEADNVELVKRLIPLCNQECGPSALLSAINKGNREIFDVLFPVSGSKDWDHVLVCIVEANRPEFFDVMLPLSNPTYNEAFLMAVELGHTHFAEALYPLIDIKEIDEYLRGFEPDTYETFYQKFYTMEAKIQKNMLNKNIGEQTLKSVVRKM